MAKLRQIFTKSTAEKLETKRTYDAIVYRRRRIAHLVETYGMTSQEAELAIDPASRPITLPHVSILDVKEWERDSG